MDADRLFWGTTICNCLEDWVMVLATASREAFSSQPPNKYCPKAMSPRAALKA
jgi:hypothetical protein